MNYAQLPLSDWDDICDATREKTDSTDLMVSGEIADKIRSISGGQKPISRYDIENVVVKDYLANTEYDDDYSYTYITDYVDDPRVIRKDEPNGVSCQPGETVRINKVRNTSCVQTNDGAVYNSDAYIVFDDNNVIDYGIMTSDDCLAMIKTDTLNNIRDIGGWSCDGGHVKHGLIYRGSRLANRTSIIVDDYDIDTLVKLLDIRSEIDFSLASEGGQRSDSVLGDKVSYTSVGTGYMYKSLIDLESSTSGKKYIKDALEKVFYNAKHNITTYIHCTHGADRTGTICYIIEALLGVSQSDCDKDYELTSFSSAGIRRRDQPYISCGVNRGSIKETVEYLKTLSYSTSIRDCAVAWCVLLGLDINDINEFRQNMISGSPEIVEPKITKDITSISLSASSSSIKVGNSMNVLASYIPAYATPDIEWISSDNNIATVVGNNHSAVVTGITAGNVVITARSGDVFATISVVVKAQPVYTNQIPLSDCPYPSTGGVMYNYRYNSSGMLVEAVTPSISYPNNATGYIPVNDQDTIRMTKGTFDNAKTDKQLTIHYVWVFDQNKNPIGFYRADKADHNSTFTTPVLKDIIWDEESLVEFVIDNVNAKYVTVCHISIGDTSVLTINEEV